MADDIYEGNSFNIDQVGADWAIWRYSADTIGTRKPPEFERLILTTEGMDELCDYFRELYPDDRVKVAAMREP